MLLVIICYECSYSIMLLVKQLINQRFTFLSPLVLKFGFFNFLFVTDRDQTILRCSKLRSCNAYLANSQTLEAKYSLRMR